MRSHPRLIPCVGTAAFEAYKQAMDRANAPPSPPSPATKWTPIPRRLLKKCPEERRVADTASDTFVRHTASAIVIADAIIELCCGDFGCKPSQIIAHGKAEPSATARHVAIYLTDKLTSLSYQSLGVMFGNRHRKTILNSVERVEDLIGLDAKFAARVERLERAIVGSEV